MEFSKAKPTFLGKYLTRKDRTKREWPYGRSVKRMKTIASRKVHRTKDVPQNAGYKKVFDSWDINDFK